LPYLLDRRNEISKGGERVRQVSVETFEEEILEAPVPCVVVFKREGCHLCQGLDRVLPRIQQRYGRGLKISTIDSFEEEHLVDLFEVDGVPTIFLFISGDGQEIPYPDSPSPFSGYSEEYLIGHLDKIVSNV